MATMWREPFFNPQEANAIARELCGLNVRSDVGPVMVHRSHAYLSCLAVSFGALGGEERALMEKALKSGNAPKAQEHENKAAAHFAQAERWIRQALESAPESRQELYGEMLQHFLHQKAYTEEVSPAQYAPEVRVA